MRLTDTQRAILTALCRPRADGNRYGTAATNQEIASEVFLSVDAVKAHLRALYRKFGVEPLPHNQKRARLVELVLEGGLLSPGLHPDGEDRADAEQPSAPVGSDPAGTGDSGAAPRAPAAPESPRAPRTPATAGRGPLPQPPRRGRRVMIAGSTALAALAALALVLTGAFSAGSAEESPAETSTPAQYKAAVNADCRLALGGQQQLAGASTAERARSYLGAIAIVGGRLQSLTPPPGKNRDLALFSAGLRRAAEFNSRVAQDPPRPGTRKSAKVVAELTLAAGQVQAGSIGYGLGAACTEIGSLVDHSARNAAFAR